MWFGLDICGFQFYYQLGQGCVKVMVVYGGDCVDVVQWFGFGGIDLVQYVLFVLVFQLFYVFGYCVQVLVIYQVVEYYCEFDGVLFGFVVYVVGLVGCFFCDEGDDVLMQCCVVQGCWVLCVVFYQQCWIYGCY